MDRIRKVRTIIRKGHNHDSKTKQNKRKERVRPEGKRKKRGDTRQFMSWTEHSPSHCPKPAISTVHHNNGIASSRRAPSSYNYTYDVQSVYLTELRTINGMLMLVSLSKRDALYCMATDLYSAVWHTLENQLDKLIDADGLLLDKYKEHYK